jgi:phosphotransferase system  glucose/maltose/N-acetylglucosamine-specific IIC component
MSNTVPQANTRTNTLAAIALVLGFVFPLLAIPVGRIARRQIARTGERGDALALIGLIFGYRWLIVVPIGLVVAEVVST